jgi:membrane protein DedA with SNARE-associated domain
LTRHPRWQARPEGIHRLLARYRDGVILGFRFMYGFRLVTPLVLGMDRKIRAGRFALLNGLSALAWSVLVAAAGYLLGEAIEPLLKEAKRYQWIILGGLLLTGFLGWALKNLRGKRDLRCSFSHRAALAG